MDQNPTPIWLFVTEYDRSQCQFAMYNIIKVIPCTLGTYHEVYNKEVAQITNTIGGQYTTMIFRRSPGVTPMSGIEPRQQQLDAPEQVEVYQDPYNDW